jgi:hypothetical protein
LSISKIIKIRACKLLQALPAAVAGFGAGDHSLAGQLLQGASQVFVFVGAKPAGEGWRQTFITAGHQSLASHLLFVGASLLAMGGGKRSSPQANIRWQASSYRGQARFLSL